MLLYELCDTFERPRGSRQRVLMKEKPLAVDLNAVEHQTKFYVRNSIGEFVRVGLGVPAGIQVLQNTKHSAHRRADDENWPGDFDQMN